MAARPRDSPMDVVCDAGPDYTEAPCLCRPSYHYEGMTYEHAMLGLAQLAKAAYLQAWLSSQQRRSVLEQRNAPFVLPVYARFLTFEWRMCIVWGLFYLGQSLYESIGDQRLPHGAKFVLQIARYGSAFTWALCGEGVFFFLCFASAGAEGLHAAIRLAALWASFLVFGCAVLWVRWAGCSTPPEHPILQMLWVSAWVPFWARLLLMLPLYAAAVLVLTLRSTRSVAWARGALPLALFELLAAALFTLPKLLLGVLSGDASKWQLLDALGVPFAWLAYTPFLTWVLLRDSRYWSSCGFTACLMGDATAGASNPMPPHRVPLLTTRGAGAGGGSAPPRFVIVDASTLVLGRRIGQGSSSIVSAATLFGVPIAVKQMEVVSLARDSSHTECPSSSTRHCACALFSFSLILTVEA